VGDEKHGVREPRRRPALVLVPAIAGVVTSLVTAVSLVPRVRAVEVVLVFATAFGGGAATATAILDFRKARREAAGRLR
jgi:hypothetical protein